MLSKRLEAFQNRLRESDIDVSLITDEDNIVNQKYRTDMVEVTWR